MEYREFVKLVDALRQRPKETEWLEFKENYHSKEEIGERISAISNSACLCNMPYGYIVFGIQNDTHEVVGTDLYGKQKKVGNEELESWISTRLSPRIDFEIIDEFDYEDKGHVCVFMIPATTGRPVSFLHEAYIRVNSTTRKLKDFPQKEAKIWKGQNTDLSRIILKRGLSPQEVLSYLSVEAYFDMMHLPLPQDQNGILDRFLSEHLIAEDEIGYSITELGALLFAKDYHLFDSLKRKAVRVIVYKGKGKIETVRERVFSKGYAICFEEMLAWINSQLPANEEIGQALRRDVRMFPSLAIRELTANCIIHQDLSERGFPMIEIYTDRIEISNPGVPLISVERFIDEYQSRNESLADIMRRLGICEEKGSGMDKTVFSIELYQLPPLRLQIQENRTVVTLFSYRKFSDIDKSERVTACYQHACLKYVSNDKMTNQSLRKRLGIDDKNYPMASRIIKDTLDARLIKDENPDIGTRRYVPYWA
jgi:predicted HTH transcriptional regulator